jgi:hypothetical protein
MPWSEVSSTVMKLGGWMRIGVVLSVLWIIGVWTYAFLTYDRYWGDFTETVDMKFLALLTLVSLALFWILGGVIFWAVRWIRRGFVGSGKP